MKYFSMFSGIGGFELGIKTACEGLCRNGQEDIRVSGGQKKVNRSRNDNRQNERSDRRAFDGTQAECVGFSEIDKYAVEVYQKHFPEHKNFGNATRIIPEEIPDFDLLVGGFPCQAFSISGKRGGFKDTRGTLFFEIARILAVKRPELLLLENVKGLLSHDHGRTFGTIIATLSELGYFCEWQVLNSKDFGVPQNRERVFIVGHFGRFGGRTVFPIGQNCGTDIVLPTLTARYWGGQANGGYLREITPQGTPQAKRVYDADGLATNQNALGGVLEQKRDCTELKIKANTKKGFEIAKEGDSINLSVLSSKTRRGRVGGVWHKRLIQGCNNTL